MIKAIILACALALPAFPAKADYIFLKEFIEKRYPKYDVVFINNDEQVLNKGAERTPYQVKVGPDEKDWLRIWIVRKGA